MADVGKPIRCRDVLLCEVRRRHSLCSTVEPKGLEVRVRLVGMRCSPRYFIAGPVQNQFFLDDPNNCYWLAFLRSEALIVNQCSSWLRIQAAWNRLYLQRFSRKPSSIYSYSRYELLKAGWDRQIAKLTSEYLGNSKCASTRTSEASMSRIILS